MICVYAAGSDMFTNRLLDVYMLDILCKTAGKTVSLHSLNMAVFVLYSQNHHKRQLIWMLQKLAGVLCVCMHAFTCVWWFCVWMCERFWGAGQVSGLGREVCVASPVCPRLSQCGVMSALSLFSRQGSYWKHTLLLRQPISSVTHRAEPSQRGNVSELKQSVD